MVTKHKEVRPMNMTYTDNYCIPRYTGSSRRCLFWNKVADGLICFACMVGVVTAMFFLLTL